MATGPPEERDPAAVAHDVREGCVSATRAAAVYRVSVDEHGMLDPVAAARLRGAPTGGAAQ